MRRYYIRIIPGDRVKVELSPYDLTRGRDHVPVSVRSPQGGFHRLSVAPPGRTLEA